MPEFTESQKALIRQIVHEVFEVVEKRHVETCPWGQKITRLVSIAIGVAIGSGIPGVAAAIKLFF